MMATKTNNDTYLNNNAQVSQKMSGNNGVVFDAKENVLISTYVNEMAKSLPAETILYASRIAGNRVAIYFNNKSHAEEAVSQGYW